jgi:hypothetical protein
LKNQIAAKRKTKAKSAKVVAKAHSKPTPRRAAQLADRH